MRGSGDYDRKKKIQSSVWQVVLLYCVSFWFWRDIGSFFVEAGNFYYDRKSIFFVVAGNFDYDRKKKDTVVCWREIDSFFVVAGNFDYDRKKKRYITTEKKKKIQSSV